MSGDNIASLPVSNTKAKLSDLETLYNLFQPKNKEVIVRAFSTFKLAFLAGILFLIFSLPCVTKLADYYCQGNVLFSKLLLMVCVIVVFFIIDKFFLK